MAVTEVKCTNSLFTTAINSKDPHLIRAEQQEKMKTMAPAAYLMDAG